LFGEENNVVQNKEPNPWQILHQIKFHDGEFNLQHCHSLLIKIYSEGQSYKIRIGDEHNQYIKADKDCCKQLGEFFHELEDSLLE